MRIIRYAILVAIGVALIVVALANRQMVTLRLLPEAMEGLFGFSWSITLPMFIVVLAAVGVGVIVGEVYEWVREHKHRKEARHMRREKEKLETEVKKTRRSDNSDDEVLALLDGATARR